MHRFTAISFYAISGKQCFGVTKPVECDDFNHLVGHDAEIDGEVCRVIGVERRSHMPPFVIGEPIGLMVDRPTAREDTCLGS